MYNAIIKLYGENVYVQSQIHKLNDLVLFFNS